MRFLVNTVSSDYLNTLSIPLIAGRDFARTDRGTSLTVALVNETMARRFWRSPDAALGNRIRRRARRLAHHRRRGTRHEVRARHRRPQTTHLSARRTELLVRHGDSRALGRRRAGAPRSTSRDPSDARSRTCRSLGSHASGSDAGRAQYLLDGRRPLMVFGVIAMILTALGTYGLVSFAARQSTHEIGIRIAVGADSGRPASSIPGTRARHSARQARLCDPGGISRDHTAAGELPLRRQPDRRGLVLRCPGARDDDRAPRLPDPCVARITDRPDRGAPSSLNGRPYGRPIAYRF